MGLFGRSKPKGASLEDVTAQLRRSELEAGQLRGQLQELRELVRHLDEDRALLLRASEALRPGMDPKALADALFEICFKPLGLASFYMALVDWDGDRLIWPLYHEGGRARAHPPRPFSVDGGLTAMAILDKKSLYIRTLDEGKEKGALFSEAERLSGLIPQSWYGVPLGIGEGWGQRGIGLLSFQSFQPDAYTESRRRIMDGLGVLASLSLKSRP